MTPMFMGHSEEVSDCIADIVKETICVISEVVVHVKKPKENGAVALVLSKCGCSGKPGTGSYMGIQLYPM